MQVQPQQIVPGVEMLPFEIGQAYIWDWGDGLIPSRIRRDGKLQCVQGGSELTKGGAGGAERGRMEVQDTISSRGSDGSTTKRTICR